MKLMRHVSLAVLAFVLAPISPCAIAQQVIATIPITGGALVNSIANAANNRIYVIAGTTLNVIDGALNTVITTVALGSSPSGIWYNKVTNNVYVSDRTDNTVTVIDGVTNMVTKVIPVGTHPLGLDVNPVTNKIYVANRNDNTVSVIDGRTNQVTATIPVGVRPNSTRVNPVTNMIYTTDFGGSTISVIDGSNDTKTNTVTVGQQPGLLLVNTVTNKAYVNNYGDTPTSVSVIDLATLTVNTISLPGIGSMDINQVTNKISETIGANMVTIIDGDTLGLTTLTVGNNPYDVESDAVTNKLYVMNNGDNTVSIVDGTNNSITTIGVGMGPDGANVNPVTNRIYVENSDSTVSVISNDNADPLQFVPITPCRLYDSRPLYGGNGPLQGGTTGTGDIRHWAQVKGCADLSTAVAYSLNITAVPIGPLGYLTIWPTGEDKPVGSTLNSLDGRIKANAAIVPAGYQGAVNAYVTNTTNIVVDIDGYFAPVSASTLAFYPLAPCRVADTRKSLPNGLGTPNLSGGVSRDFSVLSSTCNIPSTAQAYSLNFTVVPYPTFGYPLGYLEVWPTGPMPQHPVSTLNNLTGTIVANAAIVPAGMGGDITALASNNTDLVIDINGYFAAAGEGGLSLYPVAPCRVIDTRKVGSGQPFSGTLSPPVDVVDSPCATPAAAQAYVFNATVVPQGGLGYLTLWPDGTERPLTVSTLNAIDGWITSNMAIVPTTNGSVNAYASGITQLILDISSYFAP